MGTHSPPSSATAGLVVVWYRPWLLRGVREVLESGIYY